MRKSRRLLVDLVLRIGDAGEVRLTGPQDAVSGHHQGVSAVLADAVNRLVRARAGLAGVRDVSTLTGDPVGQAAGTVGRLLATDPPPDAVVARLAEEEYERARGRDLPVRLGIWAGSKVARLPWETLWLPGAAYPLCLDGWVSPVP